MSQINTNGQWAELLVTIGNYDQNLAKMANFVFMTLGKTEGRWHAANAVLECWNCGNTAEIKITAFELGYQG